MRRLIFIILAIVAIVLTTGYILFQVSKSRSFQFYGEIIPRVNTNKKVVALTFDDAPTKYSNEVVDILSEKGIKATFYVIGQNIEKYPNEAKYIVENGNELGNHSYSHQRFLLKSPSFVESEIQKTNDLIRKTGYNGEITFRPPYGKKLFSLPWYLHQHNIKTITWDVDPDTYLPTTDNNGEKMRFLVDYTIEHARPGSIILLHPFCEVCSNSRKATEEIIDKLQSMGYTFVTVTELLSYEANE